MKPDPNDNYKTTKQYYIIEFNEFTNIQERIDIDFDYDFINKINLINMINITGFSKTEIEQLNEQDYDFYLLYTNSVIEKQIEDNIKIKTKGH